KSTSYNATADLSWTLFDGLKMFATKDRLEEIQRSNEHLFRSQLQTTVSDVMKAYYNTALEQERLHLLENTLKLSEERVKISKDKYEVGKASKLEFLQAQVDYNTDQSAYVKQKEIISVRKFQLIEFLALQERDVDFNLDYQYELESPLSEDMVIDAALHNNPDLNYLKSTREVAILSKAELERQQWPSLDFNLGYSYSNLNAEAGFLQSNQTSGVYYGLSATMTVFDGLNQKRSIQNARIQAESSQLAYEQANTQLITSVRSAYLTYRNSVELADLERQNLEVAQENEEIALERYRIGKSNPLELREAQNNRLNAEVRYLEARNTAKIAGIELQRLGGLLLDQTP
ncbi:MAG: TolC family protein, partial [Cyclobacteriaceae bacterium]